MSVTRPRLVVILTILAALVLLGAVAAKAEPEAQSSATNLAVHASARLPNGDTVSLTPGVLAGSTVYYGGKIPVGPDAFLTLLDTTIGGGRGYCSGFWGERDIEFRFKSWSTNAADTYTSSEWYESTTIEAHGIHDVPGTDVDQYVYLTYDAVCL